MNRAVPTVDLPVGPKPGWEVDESEDGEVQKSIADRYITFAIDLP
jgi:hypothetical protein